MRKQKLKNLTIEVIVWIISLSVLLPVILVIFNSLKTPAESTIMSIALPESPQWDNYRIVLSEGRVLRSFINSLVISIGSVITASILGTMAAFVLARNNSKLNKKVHKYFMIGLVVPVQLISLIEVLKSMRIYNSYVGLVLVYVAIFLPMTIMLSFSFFRSLPKELDEAAFVDGCSCFYLFFKVILPISKPVITTVFVIIFMFVWNDFQFPLYLITDSSKWTLVLGVYGFMGRYSSQWNLVSAHIIITSIPVVLIYLLGQKYIVQGMVSGAVKG